MDKCYVILSGGIGNQLFQIANGFAYSRDHNKELVLVDQSWTASQGRKPSAYKDGLYSNFNFGVPSPESTVITETFDSPLKYVEGDVTLDGYFQSLKYFYNHKEDFISSLKLPEVNLSFIQSKNVAFHIRRGDYVAFRDVHLICGTEYFNYEFERFKDYQINVFTDSANMVSQEFAGYDFNIIQSNSAQPELNEMIMMSRHDNFVGSNSSLSWWASLLGNKKEKVIFPNKWIKTIWELNHQIYSFRGDMTLSDKVL